jgi:hypothetical protein
MKKALITHVIVLVLAVSSMAAADEVASAELNLHLHLEKGQLFRCTRTTETVRIDWFGMVEEETTTSTISTRTLEVLAVDEEGTATIKVTSDRETFSMQHPYGGLEYDSETTPLEGDICCVTPLAAVVGLSYTAKVTPTGEVREIEGSETLRKAVVNALPKDNDLGEMIIEWAKNTCTDEALQRLTVSLAFPVGLHPAEPVAVEESWTVETVCDAMLTNTLRARNTYTLISRQDGIATVRCEGVVEPDPDAEPSPPTIRSVFRGTQESTFQVDEKTGMVVKAETKLDFEGKYLMRQTPEAEQETSVPSTLAITIELKLEQKAKGTDTEEEPVRPVLDSQKAGEHG